MEQCRIETVEDIKSFFRSLYEKYNLEFMPDDDFNEFENEDGTPRFSSDQAEYLNGLMVQCFNVANQFDADIYEIASEVHTAEFKKKGIFPDNFGRN